MHKSRITAPLQIKVFGGTGLRPLKTRPPKTEPLQIKHWWFATWVPEGPRIHDAPTSRKAAMQWRSEKPHRARNSPCRDWPKLAIPQQAGVSQWKVAWFADAPTDSEMNRNVRLGYVIRTDGPTGRICHCPDVPRIRKVWLHHTPRCRQAENKRCFDGPKMHDA